MLFVDIAKAFDKIWHDGLISKMMRLGFSDQILKIIHSYLNSREFRVRVENCLSSPRPVKSEIPQGSLLGPRLFNLYINDIPKADNVHLAMYVDDTAIIRRIREEHRFLSNQACHEFDPSTTPGWCLIKYVPYLPIELFLARLTGSMSSATVP
ncbi:probable RNA-directed DNA polymerase from transposon BS [Trichonephila clavipes]|nr:probable RNA-directed DNA polymerase from transposon BS [Trichonephila clavipes]